MLEILLVLIPCAVFGNLGAWLLMRWKPSWSRRKTAILAALPLPSIIWIVCLVVFFNAATSSQESCGVDACGMSMMFSAFGMGYGLIGYFVGLAGALGAIAVAKRLPADGEVAATFE
ncbi:MAG: hypothetical protein KGM49_13185 [Sphingomonadales bacterium]|nr:hypothetical protein [Sphingomonadales bacterium]